MQYAHRKCVQEWCNEKGDISCEICHQVGLLWVKVCQVSFLHQDNLLVDLVKTYNSSISITPLVPKSTISNLIA